MYIQNRQTKYTRINSQALVQIMPLVSKSDMVLFAFLTKAIDKTNKLYASVNDLTKMTSLSKRTVVTSLQKLEELNVIARKRLLVFVNPAFVAKMELSALGEAELEYKVFMKESKDSDGNV